jgi:hypothetical protein
LYHNVRRHTTGSSPSYTASIAKVTSWQCSLSVVDHRILADGLHGCQVRSAALGSVIMQRLEVPAGYHTTMTICSCLYGAQPSMCTKCTVRPVTVRPRHLCSVHRTLERQRDPICSCRCGNISHQPKRKHTHASALIRRV